MTDLTPENVVVGTAAGPGMWMAATAGEAKPLPDAAPGVNWLSMGYIEDDSLSVSQSLSVNDITGWQQRGPIKRVKTEQTFEVGVTLLEVNPTTMAAWFDSAVPTPDVNGDYTIAIDTSSAQNERSVLLRIQDGAKMLQFYFDRCVVSDAGEVSFSKDSAAPFPITFTALDTDGTPGDFDFAEDVTD